MSNLFALFESDAKKERDGVPLKIEGATFWLRRAGGNNRAYRYALALAASARRDELKDEANAEVFNVQEEILQAAFADCVIAGWENVDGRDGQPLEFSSANALDLVRSCPSVWDAIKAAAIDDSLYRVEVEDGEALGKQLSGSLSGVPGAQTLSA
jgi:hypothetical protein